MPSTDLPSTDTTPQLPVGARQNLFGNLLQSLEQSIGLQSSPAAAASTSAPTANTPMQNYLPNAPQNLQADALKVQNLAG